MTLVSDISELFEKTDQNQADGIVLTPNERLSRFLRKNYNQHHAQQGRKAWPSLNAYSLQAWIQQNWEKLSFSAFVPAKSAEYTLSPLLKRLPMSLFQERILWQQVVSNHSDTPPLLSSKATATLAMEAWHLLQRWQLDLPAEGDSNLPIFKAWCDAFLQECEGRALLSSSQQAATLRDAIQRQQLKPPSFVALYGFDEHTPQLQSLLEAMQAQGSKVEDFRWQRSARLLQRHEFNDENVEIEASALWARKQLQQQPDASIAIVVPKLAQLREKIDRIFTRVFEPQYIFPQQRQHAAGFNISAGQSLDSVPLVAAALNALTCNNDLLEIEDISRFLRSPFFGSDDEMNQRALLDIELRETDFRLSLKQLTEIVGLALVAPSSADNAESGQEETRRRCPNLYESLTHFADIATNLASHLPPSQWAQVFHRQLQVLGWPGQRNLDTLEYQQVQRWREALVEMAKLDCVCNAISWREALQNLRALLQQISFQAQTKASPIQILGILEAAALPFDHLWVMNMDDETWPPLPNPNPMLPLRFQIAHGFPQSSPERELAYARRLLERFSGSASTVIYSHATQQDDKQMRVSTLLAELPPRAFTLQADASFAEQLFAHREIESSLDSCGPKIVDPSSIRGGTAIIKDQSACPFQAFARHRLHAQQIPSPSMGLDALDRGNLVHKVMELIWRELRNQSKLLQKSETELKQLVQSAVKKALRSLPAKHSVGKHFLQIEGQRLTAQAEEWLELEKMRQPFTIVSNEGRKKTMLGKLPLTVRYDRVDRLEDGSLLVLDYKTGKQEVRSWSTQRPDEPQVPLYCVINHKKVSAAAFGQISADEIAFKGIAQDETVAPGMKTPDMLFKLELPQTWPEIIDHWRNVLGQLGRDFMAGAAAVDPKKPGLTCRYCELKPLCRIKEQFHLDDDELQHEDSHQASENLLELTEID